MGVGVGTDVYDMVANNNNNNYARALAVGEEEMGVRRGPWTVEEDLILVNYIAKHGEGRWNSLSRCAGLKRNGKSCRLRWLNYLRPDVRRGNITPEEQLLILELHSRWGNRWSKIAEHLPGRTDNEIKNYWRTRVQKHAKQLKCDVNSQRFKDVVRYLWMPRLVERIHAASVGSAAAAADPCVIPTPPPGAEPVQTAAAVFDHVKASPDDSSMGGTSSDSSAVTNLSSPPFSDVVDCCYAVEGGSLGSYREGLPAEQVVGGGADGYSGSLPSPCGYVMQGLPDLEQNWWAAAGDFPSEYLWTDDDFWFLQQQLQ